MLLAARKLVVRAGLAIVAVAVLGVAALAWRFSRAPLTLPFATPYIEKAFSRIAPDAVAHAASTELVFSKYRPEFRVVGVRLFHSDGTRIATFPELSVWPSLRAAVRGQFAVARVGLSGARLALVRSEDGVVRMGAGDGTGDLLAALMRRGQDSQGPSYLWRIDIDNAHLEIEDRKTKAALRAEDADLRIRLEAGGVTAQLVSDLTLRSETDRLAREISVPLTATANVVLRHGGGLESVAFDAHGERGRILPVANPEAPVPVHALDLSGTYEASAGLLELVRVEATIGSAHVEMTARVPVGAAGVAEFDGEVTSLPATELTALWPPGHSGKTREWIAGNVREGHVPSGTFKLRIPVPDVPKPLPPGSVDVAVKLTGLKIDYLSPMDPAREVRGSGRLTEDHFEAEINGAVVRTLAVHRGRVWIDHRAKPARAKVSIDAAGATAEVLSLIDRPPLHLARKMKISTRAGGHSEVHADLELPLARDIDDEDVHVTAEAKVHEARLDELVAGVGIDAGELLVHVKDRRFEVDGDTALLGAPAVEGRVHVDVNVEPRAGEDAPARLRGSIEGSNAGMQGEIALDAEGLHSAALTALRFEGTNVTADVARDADGRYDVHLGGRVLDLAPLFERMRADDDESDLPRIRWALNGEVASLLTGAGIELVDVRAQGRGEAADIEFLQVAGTIQDGGTLDLGLATSGADRKLNLSSDQGAKIIKALGIHDHLVGGRLTVAATIRNDASETAGEGEIDMSDFRIMEAPLLAKILSLGSLDGLATMLGREGIGVARTRVPFSWSGKTITIRGARAVGAIGATADGTVDRERNAVDIRGQVIPAYTLNSALGKIPLIGNLLVGGEGKGVFGIDYTVTGTSEAPRIGVNPMSMLAPGVLRQLFIEPFTQRGTADGP
jgi:hypothetical protein